MAQVNFRMDDELKKSAEAEFRQMGLTMSAAITLMCTQVVMKHQLPFAIETPGATRMPGRRTMRLPGPIAGESQGARFRAFAEAHAVDMVPDFAWNKAEVAERELACAK